MRMDESLELDIYRAAIRQYQCLQGKWVYDNDETFISDIIEASFPIFTENLYPTFLLPIKILRWQTINQEHKMLQCQHDDL